MNKEQKMELSTYLVQKCHVDSKHLPFYLRWIELFREFQKERSQTKDMYNLLSQFLESLVTSHPEWQVNQAKKAVIFFIQYEQAGNNVTVNSVGPGTPS